MMNDEFVSHNKGSGGGGLGGWDTLTKWVSVSLKGEHMAGQSRDPMFCLTLKGPLWFLFYFILSSGIALNFINIEKSSKLVFFFLFFFVVVGV